MDKSNTNAEKALIGSILLDSNKSLFICSKTGITPESFIDPVCRKLYEAIEDISKSGSELDVISVEDKSKVDSSVIDKIVDITPTAAHCQYYADKVHAEDVKRKATVLCQQAVAKLADGGEHIDIIGKLQSELNGLSVTRDMRFRTIESYRKEKLEQWRKARDIGFVGIPSCFQTVNTHLGGWRKKSVGIIAGYRGGGKSTLLAQEAFWLAKTKQAKVGIFSLEDSGDIVTARMVGGECRESVFGLDTGIYSQKTFENISRTWENTNGLPLWTLATSLSLPQIASSATRLKSLHGLDILYIDHIQLISPYQLPGHNRNDTVAAYSQQLTALAKALDIAVVLVSQLSRSSEQQNRKPRMSDLRDSGTLEQDARQICILYRDYEEACFKYEIVKNNYGPSGHVVNMNRIDKEQRFEEIANIKGGIGCRT